MTRKRSGAVLLLCTAMVAGGVAPQPPGAARAADPQGAGALLAAHCRARDRLTSLRARFVQTKAFAALGEEDRSQGTLYYRKPGAVRWQFTAPDSAYTILRGDSGWAVFPDIRQVQRFALHGSGAANALAIIGFGSCGPDLERSFRISLANGSDGTPMLVLQPLVAEIAAAFDRLELTLDPVSHLPRQVSMHETSGDTVRFEFFDLKPGVLLDPALFEFAVPKGYEVVG